MQLPSSPVWPFHAPNSPSLREDAVSIRTTCNSPLLPSHHSLRPFHPPCVKMLLTLWHVWCMFIFVSWVAQTRRWLDICFKCWLLRYTENAAPSCKYTNGYDIELLRFDTKIIPHNIVFSSIYFSKSFSLFILLAPPGCLINLHLRKRALQSGTWQIFPSKFYSADNVWQEFYGITGRTAR